MTKIRVVVLLIAAMSSALCVPTFAQTCSLPGFTQAPIYPVGGDVRSVAAADFDGDGSPDLAVANADSSNVTVVLKAGRTQPAIINTYAVGTFPLSVATGDFTGDGKIDIVSGSNSSSTISLLRNNGSGGFVPGGTFNIASGALDIAVGDFNNNGNLDVAVAVGSGVSILLSNGQGGFSGATFILTSANKIIAADFNNDGKLDLATANSTATQIRLGNGAGQFGTASCGVPSASGLAAGDVNNDGKLDLVTANVSAAQIQIYPGNGAGCVGASTNIDVLNAGRPGFVALGDLNNDGNLDIVAGATVLRGNGNGTFGPPFAFGMGSLGSDPGANTVIADFNGDSKLDIASASTGSAGILFGDGAGGFRFAAGPAGGGAYGIAQGDLNSDGKLDVAAMSNGNFVVMFGDGTGNLGSPSIVTVPSASSFVGPVIGDFNGDTKLDVAVVDATHNGPGGLPRFHVSFGNGLGGFGSTVSTSFDAADPFAVSGGDLNGDGKIDLVTVNRGGGNNNEGSISIGLSDGAGHFTIQPNASARTAANPIGVAFADFNNDGKLDLAVPSGFGFSILLGNGAGGFAPRTHITTANASSLRAADFNNDGKVDLAMVSEEINGKTSVVLGDGVGGFTAPLQFNLGNFPSDIAVADFNNDNKPDLAVAISRQDPFPAPLRSNIAVVLGDGSGGFGSPITMPADRNASRIIAADLDGNGRPDIVTANQLVNNLTVAINTCAGSSSPSSTISGIVTDGNGQGIADVTMILESDVAEPQIVFTNQSGNYVFTYAANLSHSLKVTPSKSGYSFNPLAISFTSSSSVGGDKTASFTGTPTSTPAAGQIPILLTRENSQRAVALDSVTWTSEPFAVTTDRNFSVDQRTRLSLFAVNVELGAGETSSVIQAEAEDPNGQTFPLTIEFFGSVPNFAWLKQVVVKLPNEVANSSEIRISLKVRGTAGNKVIVKLKP
jgi:hypothetical protein